ncbi:GntR family transcriptional regulator [Aerococcus sp. Group 1]|uniref:GntR family transcriptional regulator n=1 Tax=Aerococcus urinae (strain CCUG 59500 / ACS-120-V-Col10a) TaxID=2976812 RepID=UPI00227AFAAE|nr:GntR family transcriptional regulator [Aerococcus sp. Group 1]MCY3061498.1 GntR family transcriptional regulator [Aerococcus sp. Group 1]
MAKSMSYKEKAYRYLKEQIDNNVLLAGTHLKENDLAKQLDMSRTPIRKALDQLAKENMSGLSPIKGPWFARTLSIPRRLWNGSNLLSSW